LKNKKEKLLIKAGNGSSLLVHIFKDLRPQGYSYRNVWVFQFPAEVTRYSHKLIIINPSKLAERLPRA
jgi:hypothetical protein